MDVFIEKIVAKKKDTKDTLISLGIVVGGLVAIIAVFSIQILAGFGAFFMAAILYVGYLLLSSRNIEYEYAVTNGDLDIDKIISRRKRKRIFSASCKDFDIVARIKSVNYTNDVKNIQNKILSVSSMEADNVYFITLNYKGERTVLFFEPDSRMLDAFRTFIPRKVFE